MLPTKSMRSAYGCSLPLSFSLKKTQELFITKRILELIPKQDSPLRQHFLIEPHQGVLQNPEAALVVYHEVVAAVE